MNGVAVFGSQEFALDGHDCPLGEYPSVAVPIGRVGESIVAAYTGDGRTQLTPIPAGAHYVHHNETTASTLRGFDPARHGLFAFDKSDVVMYDLGGEREFYSRLLRSSAAFYIEPFYRLSLALETNDPSLIKPLYFSCANQFSRHAPEFIDGWMRTVASASFIIESIQHEWLSRLARPPLERSYAAAAREAVSVALSEPEIKRLGVLVGPEMNAVTIGRALDVLALEDPTMQIGAGDAYAAAVRASLGLANLPSTNSTDVFQGSTAQSAPSAREVAAASGLSLPLLEFRNIVLGKDRVVEFLRLSKCRISSEVLLRQVLDVRVYEQHFKRRAVKIRRRQVFTYAEVLSLVGYEGTVLSPSWMG